jgi:hypothetical protein
MVVGEHGRRKADQRADQQTKDGGATMKGSRIQSRIDDAGYRVRMALGAATYHGKLSDSRSQSFASVMLSTAQYWARKAWRHALTLEGEVSHG